MLRRSSVIHARQRLDGDTCPVDTVRGDWYITTSGVKAISAYNKKASSRQSLMHDAPLSHRCLGARVRGHWESHSRGHTIAMPMATVMCMPNVRLSPAIQPSRVTCTRSSIVRHADAVSPTWTPGHPAGTPIVKKLWHHTAFFDKGGTHL
jgi:hypothetical protein